MKTARRIRFSLMAVATFVLPVSLLLVNCGGGGGGSSPDNGNRNTGPTAVGTTTGSLVSKTIGTTGGSLSLSSAGSTTVTVTIPAGALATDTVIGIQPITNNAHGALGGGFRLTPEGASFPVPVQLTFTYTDEDLKGSTLEALSMAYQDARGFWRVIKDVTRDDTAKTLTVSTTHFSDWSRLIGWQIRPPAATIKPGDSVALTVKYCEPVDDGDVTTLLSECSSDALLSPLVSGWSVNGIAGGDLAVGTVNGSGGTATYQSSLDETPATYAVSVQLDTRSGSKVLLVSNITVQGWPQTYTGTINFTNSQTGYASATSTATITWTKVHENSLLANYEPSGSITGTVSMDNCDTKQYSVPFGTATTDGSLSVYSDQHYVLTLIPFSMGGTLSLTCHNIYYPSDTYEQGVGFMIVFDSSLLTYVNVISTPSGKYLTYTDMTTLAGTLNYIAADVTTNATWNFTAQ